MFSITEIEEAYARIKPYIIETPLFRMPTLDPYLGCEVYLKAENMQITGAFKLRGALNRALSLSSEARSNGLVCASSGNHGRGIAYAAKMLGAKATVVMPYTAPEVKVLAIKALGAKVVQCETSCRFDVAEQICNQQGATLIPPYDDEFVMAGQGTAGLEIAKQCPEIDAVIVPVSGGGLISGVSIALKETSSTMKVYGAEPAALPRYTMSLQAGKPTQVPYRQTLADALVSQKPGNKCFPCVQKYVDQVVPVSDTFLLKGMKLLLMEGKILAEPSGCIGIAAVLQGQLSFQKKEKVCFLISGGSVGIQQLAALEPLDF
ncbi:MAG: threonine/serine dehydratase [Oscillospiraceae bacterium]|nr:threonine/serine dehydratase [Oscillospiraceae bacterium]